MKTIPQPMATSRQNSYLVSRLETLVNELIKYNPQEDILRSCMKDVGLIYCSDPVIRLNRVLEALESAKMRDLNPDPKSGKLATAKTESRPANKSDTRKKDREYGRDL